jgi:hypothetical protein
MPRNFFDCASAIALMLSCGVSMAAPPLPNPVEVRVVNTPIQTFSSSPTFQQYIDSNTQRYTVPPGKRAIVLFMSGRCVQGTPALPFLIFSVPGVGGTIVPIQGTVLGDQTFFTHQTRLVFEAGME